MEGAAFTIERALDAGQASMVTDVVSASHPSATAPLAAKAWSERARTVAWNVAKRISDILLAVVILVLALPLMAVIALLVKLDSPGPVLFRQTRYGRNRKPFVVLKFRTMKDHVSPAVHQRYIAELACTGAQGGPGLKKLTGDVRVTRTGAVLRKSSFDELPQLLNVMMGTMSIVGPRPAIEYELDYYQPEHFDRFDVRPGLTGLWQVSGRNELGFDEMLALDTQYARTAGPLTDAQILLRTPLALLRGGTA